MSDQTRRMLSRLGELVMAETPSGDAARLTSAYELLEVWGQEALGRSAVQTVVDGVPHLLWEAAGQPRVLVLGHADTVFAAGTTASRPFEVSGDRATGPGVFDMKSGLVIAFEALAQVADASEVAVLITGDEEVGSLTSRALVEEVATGCEAVLVLEPSLDGALKTVRKGGSFYRVAFEGRAAHAGLEPERGHNALIELAGLVTWCASAADTAAGTTVTPTLASAGTTNNVVPASAELVIDVRSSTTAEQGRVHDELMSWRPANPAVRVRVAGGVNRVPLEAASSASLLGLARAVAAAKSLPAPVTASVGGASDANFTAALGIPTLDGLGAVGGGAHADDEWIEVSSLDARVALVAGMLEALTSAEPGAALAAGGLGDAVAARGPAW